MPSAGRWRPQLWRGLMSSALILRTVWSMARLPNRIGWPAYSRWIGRIIGNIGGAVAPSGNGIFSVCWYARGLDHAATDLRFLLDESRRLGRVAAGGVQVDRGEVG